MKDYEIARTAWTIYHYNTEQYDISISDPMYKNKDGFQMLLTDKEASLSRAYAYKERERTANKGIYLGTEEKIWVNAKREVEKYNYRTLVEQYEHLDEDIKKLIVGEV
jgi:hypothetical protein